MTHTIGQIERELLPKILEHVNTNSPAGQIIKDMFHTRFGKTITQLRMTGSTGKATAGRKAHHDFELLTDDGEWRKVEFKGSSKYTPIDPAKQPWTTGVQFYNGPGSQFTIASKYAKEWHNTLPQIKEKYQLLLPIPEYDEWTADAFRQADPKTPFVIEMKEKCSSQGRSSLGQHRTEFVQQFITTITPLDVDTLTTEVYNMANKVLKEKEYWLQIHGDLDGQFDVRWSPQCEFSKIVNVLFVGKKDLVMKFECADNFNFSAILRWGKRIGMTNLRLDLK